MEQKVSFIGGGSLWKTARYLLPVLLIVLTLLNYLQVYSISGISRIIFERQTKRSETKTVAARPDYLIDTPGCRIPKFDPFHPSVAIYYKNISGELGTCYKDRYLWIDGNRIYVNATLVKRDFNTTRVKCFYQPIRRPEDEKLLSRSIDLVTNVLPQRELNLGSPMTDEFVRITCYSKETSLMIFEDYFALAILKPEVEIPRTIAATDALSEEPLNVILLAIDSVSKLNFIRQFPKTNEFLKTVVKPFEFNGHTKVADNTFVNIVPLLTGRFVSDYRNSKNMYNTYYDDLDFVWKEYARAGYRTLYAEDYPDWGTFVYLKKGFLKPPTDYYSRPIVHAVESTDWRAERGTYCFGYISEPEFYYDYLMRFTKVMDKRPFFAFTFVSRISHNYLNEAKYLDEPTFELFRKLQDSGVLNRTAVIFFSDHGIRFGGILNTYIGKIEERMPFMFQYYPKWFLKKYPDVERSLTTNQFRLTTPFDVHKTMQDILVRSLKGKHQENFTGYGQSLFKEISPKRTCKDAKIHPHWCTCHDRKEIPKTDMKTTQAAWTLVQTINEWTNSTSRESLCAEFYMAEVIDAYVSLPSEQEEEVGNDPDIEDLEFKAMEYFKATMDDIVEEEKGPLRSSDVKWSSETYLVTVSVSPGSGVFEGTLVSMGSEFVVLGDISRVNRYGDQSWCVDDQTLKKYCYCKTPRPKEPPNNKPAKPWKHRGKVNVANAANFSLDNS